MSTFTDKLTKLKEELLAIVERNPVPRWVVYLEVITNVALVSYVAINVVSSFI